jgi:hypothetical protein
MNISTGGSCRRERESPLATESAGEWNVGEEHWKETSLLISEWLEELALLKKNQKKSMM